MTDETFAYDRLLYPDHPVGASHPDRLAVMALLGGIEPAPIDRARVLEIGCGGGGNLIPMACALPGARFVGIDLAARPIETGHAAIAALGLANIELRRMDLMDLPADVGTFDYVIAHGFYSWVPPAVRDRLMQVLHAHLAPHGVAYVSYNAYPGAYPRRMLRKMMLFHVDRDAPPGEQVQQAIALLAFLAGQNTQDDAFGNLLRAELERARTLLPGHVFHDDLAPVNDPVWLHEFVAHAEGHGLQHLGEADYYPPAQIAELRPNTREALAQLGDNLLAREQYIDFLKCRGFRMSLLCRAEADLSRAVSLAQVERLHVASEARLVEEGAAGAATYAGPTGARLAVAHPVVRAALDIAAAAWPRVFSFGELRDAALARVGNCSRDEGTTALAQTLILALGTDVAALHLHPPRYACAAGQRPLASALLRRQVAQGETLVTTLRHGLAKLDDPLERALVPLLDGAHDRAALAAAIPADLRAAGAARIDAALASLARRTLLLA